MSSFDFFKEILGMFLLFNVFVVPVYTMSQEPNKNNFMLKSGLVFPKNIMFVPILLLILPFYGNGFLKWIVHSTSDLVMRFVYLLQGTECVVQRATCLMVCMELLMMGMCRTFVHRFKLSGLWCSLKAFMLKSLSPWKTYMLNTLAL